jgi:hypothetical protein
MRAVELLLVIYGNVLPGQEESSKRNKNAANDLISERSFERDLQAGIREAVIEKQRQREHQEYDQSSCRDSSSAKAPVTAPEPWTA